MARQTECECAGLAGAALATSAATTLELRDGEGWDDTQTVCLRFTTAYSRPI